MAYVKRFELKDTETFGVNIGSSLDSIKVMQIFCEDTCLHLLVREECFKRIQDEVSAFLVIKDVETINLNGFVDFVFDKENVTLKKQDDLYILRVQNETDHYYFSKEELKDLFKI